ncbi:hypothetical protein OTU49_000766, partial [Cherax quadricarinatus]
MFAHMSGRTRGGGGGNGGEVSSSTGGLNNKTWARDMEERKKGWSRDSSGGWVRENAGGGSTSNLANASITNNLRYRRRSNSSVPSLCSNGNGYSNSGCQRGSSASPRAPHSKGFWVQEPEDYHSRWVTTKTPDSEGSTTPLTWPPTGGGGSHGRDGSYWGACISQPSSPHRAPATPPPLGCSTTLPKVYKSHATWVRNGEDCGTPEHHASS